MQITTRFTADHEFADAQRGTPWHETPAVAAYIATIDIDELYLTRKLVVMSDDALHYTGDPLETLQAMRRKIIDTQFGMPFSKACDVGRAYEYLDFEDQHPRVDEVLCERFGDPRRFGNEDKHKATLMMRFEARQKAALARRAA